MSELRKYEKYDIDEYFIKFLDISPILLYTNEIDKYNMSKLKLQRKLLHSFSTNILSKDKVITKYKEFMEYSSKKKELYSDVQNNFLKVLKNLEDTNKLDEINNMNLIMKSLDN